MVNKDPNVFIIRVMIGGIDGDINLSEPQFEKQVCAAASRFYSLRRKRKSGRRAESMDCSLCENVFISRRAYLRHLADCIKSDIEG